MEPAIDKILPADASRKLARQRLENVADENTANGICLEASAAWPVKNIGVNFRQSVEHRTQIRVQGKRSEVDPVFRTTGIDGKSR